MAFPLASDVMLRPSSGDTLDIILELVLSEGRGNDEEETVSSAAASDRWCFDRRSFLASGFFF